MSLILGLLILLRILFADDRRMTIAVMVALLALGDIPAARPR